MRFYVSRNCLDSMGSMLGSYLSNQYLYVDK